MVFESLVADLMNRYLGDFVENLDKSQLRIGIWGGDVVLTNLFVKESALDELDLPIKVAFGNIGKLVLKVPWKNLYTERTIATLEGLYIVAVPNAGIKYNEEKERRAAWDAKQKELQRIDDAKKAEASKNKPDDPQSDSFAEKLATNIIKNLEVHVKDIHIRFEDEFTNPEHPFSVGVTLRGLHFETTDENWKVTIIKEAVMMIHKMVSLDSLSLYWNSGPLAQSMRTLPRERLQAQMKNKIVAPDNKTNYQYLIEPITSTAHLRLNTKPEKDRFTVPKVFLKVVFDEIAIGLTRAQYLNVMELLESLERMNLASKFRKYRPDVPRKGNAKAWWLFAYQCTVEETVRRRQRIWSWQNISKHRLLCRDYKDAYKKRLACKKAVPPDLLERIEACERELTVFNITLVRQQAELEVKKEGVKKQKASGGGWFGGWWGGGNKEVSQEADIGEQFQKLMTDEEKAKLYQALGYEEAAGDPTLPREYEANKLEFQLTRMSLSLREDSEVVKVSIDNTHATLAQRPAASAITLEANMQLFSVLGTRAADGSHPLMVSSQCHGAGEALLDVMLQTNPLDGACDTRVKVSSRPLEIVYDAPTINKIQAFFKPPEYVHLAQLQSAAMSKFEELKEQTATGLQHAIDLHKYTEITVNLQPSYVLVPHTGVYRKKESNLLVLELGSLNISSEKVDRKGSQTPTEGQPLSKEDVMRKAYDKFNLHVQHFQLLYACAGEDWQAARRAKASHMHIVSPVVLDVQLYKAFMQDISLAKVKIAGVLPKLTMTLSDKRLEQVVRLVSSIPLPESSPRPPEESSIDYNVVDVRGSVATEGDAARLARTLGADQDSSSDEELEGRKKGYRKQKSRDTVNLTDVELNFEVQETCLALSKHTAEKELPLMKIVIDSLGTGVVVRTFDLEVTAYLGGIYMQHKLFKAPPHVTEWYQKLKASSSEGPLINLVNTPTTGDSTSRLLTVQYRKANRRAPGFLTVYNNTEQTISVKFTALELLLHQEAILSLIEFGQNLQKALAPPAAPTTTSRPAPTGATLRVHSLVEGVRSRGGSPRSRSPLALTPTRGSHMHKAVRKKPAAPEEIIDVSVDAQLDVFAVAICTQHKIITDVKVKGLSASVSVQKSKTSVQANLKNITVFDPTPNALYPQILTFEKGDVFNMAVVVYNGATEGPSYSNMSVVDTSVKLTTGSLKIVFLNKFVNSLLQFVEQFQFALDAVKQAGREMAESAADAAKDFSQKASRVQLDIRLKAPTVIIPQHSSSTNAVVADLGLITVSNSFELPGKYSPQDGVPAVLDRMAVKLTQLKLSRALMLGTEMQAECLLLEPVNLELTVLRNLAASWYHGHPDIAIEGHMRSLVVSMSQGDYTTLMGILSDNLQEGAPSPVAATGSTTAAQQVANQTTAEVTVQAESGGSEVTALKTDEVYASVAAIAEQDARKLEVYARLKFNFTLVSVKAELFNGNSNLVTGLTARDPAQSLGAVMLTQLVAHGQILTDKEIKATVGLHRVQLTDTRPGRDRGITKMIARAGGFTDETHNMIDVDFTQAQSGSKDINMKVNGLYICVCLEYLMMLADFFSQTQNEASAKLKAAQEATRATVHAGPETASSTPAAEATPAASSELNLLFTMEHPEIILVENAMDPDTHALILQTSILFKLRMDAELQNMMASVCKLQILSCLYAPDKRQASTALILQPTNINLISSAPQGKGHHVDISLDDVTMNISPATIRTITATLSSLSAKKEEEEEEGSDESKLPKALWDVKRITDFDFWFLRAADEGSSVDLVLEIGAPGGPAESRGEQLLLQMKHVVVKLEGGVGSRTVPLIITEMSFHSEVKDWSSRLSVIAEMAIEVAYYNEGLAVWEPLIEPVELEGRHRPWEISLEVLQNDEIEEVLEEDLEVSTLPPPKMTINVKSHDVLQATLTKTGLDVITKLGKAFGDAYNLVEVIEKPGELVSPYVLRNETGRPLTVRLDDNFEMPPQADAQNHVELGPGDVIALQNSRKLKLAMERKSVIKTTQEDQLRTIHVILREFGATREVKVVKAEWRAFGINQKVYPNEIWQFIAQVDASYGTKTVTLRSILQVKNHLPFAMELFYKLSDDAMARCGEVESGQTFSVPLDAVYAAPYELYFRPCDARYGESKSAFNWKQTKEGGKVIKCEAAKQSLEPIYFRAKVKAKNVLFESTGEQSATSYVLHLFPCVRLRNSLPLYISCNVQGTDEWTTIEPGDKQTLFNVKPGSSSVTIKIDDYLGCAWVATKLVEEAPQELSVLTFTPQPPTAGQAAVDTLAPMDLGIHSSKVRGRQELAVFCPYWMINKTGRALTYRNGVDTGLSHAPEHKGALLFSFRAKAFFGKKKASLRVSESDWSDKFSLDTVGSSGTVVCKYRVTQYEVGVHIQLASGGLTKIVTFTPFFMIINQAQYAIEVKEPKMETSVWMPVQPGQCVPFWPLCTDKRKLLVVRVGGEEEHSAALSVVEPHTTLVRLSSKYGGIDCVCQPMESAVSVTFQQYQDGMAAVRIVNHTRLATVEYSQSELKNSVSCLEPGHTVLYTWQDPLGKRELTWSAGEKRNQKNDLVKDDIQDFYYNSDYKVYWVSFLDGMQRMLLFTEEQNVALTAQQAGELERIEQEINLTLQGMGLSLVNNEQHKEIAYMGIASSGVIWEERKKKRFKALNWKQSVAIENAYQKFLADAMLGKKVSPRRAIESKLEVDFETCMMIKPRSTPIRRGYEDGVWVRYRTSPHQLQLHLKIHRLQLDNQLPGAVFQTVLAPMPLPKSVAAESVPKPFTEMSVMIRKREFSNVMQFKYFKVLIQELEVKVDQGFINALLSLFMSGEPDEETIVQQFRADLKTVDSVLLDFAVQSSADEQKHFYDILHISPLKVHLSFSMYGGDETDDKKPTQLHSNVLNLFLQSVGIVLTDIQDVVFKLAYFEREFTFYNQSQLVKECTTHYSTQAIKQMYVLVLGLDVLGNPFGVIRGLATGIEDLFYEPYQGAIQGPEEFAEGLALGVKSLLGHAVGGAAGAVSRITGALGKGIATLTLDDEYQKKRREQLNKKPEDLKEGLARGGKGLVMGVFDGVTGIVRKPVEGAMNEGVGGFFKGVGKGLVGVVTRPASGVVDFASSSFAGIKRVTDLSDEVRRLRPPRFLHNDGIVRPYLYSEAEGNDTLQDVDKGRYALTDQYVCHAVVTKNLKNILLVTDKRIIFATKGEIFGHWDCAWTYSWDMLTEPPKATDKGIQILLKEKQKKSFFSSGTMGKVVAVDDRRMAQWVVDKMVATMQNNG